VTACCSKPWSPVFVVCNLQAALLSEREETKLALVMEKQALEEARTARIKVGQHTRRC
jgi:hypothetical protein